MLDHAALQLLLIPPIFAVILLAVGELRWAARINIIACGITFLASLRLAISQPATTDWILVDPLNIWLVLITAFISLTTSIFSAGYLGFELQSRGLSTQLVRFYHAMFQAFLFTLYLALLANNLGVLWVAIEGATLTTVLMVSLYRTPAAIEAAWKYFILCGVGIALALFGTILIYLSAQPVLGGGEAAMTWTGLLAAAPKIEPGILDLAFVFLLIGYGTKVGLFPLHAWLPDAHAEGPTPISAVLSGLLLNVALYAVLRFKMLLSANGKALDAGPIMMVMGLLTVLMAVAMLYRRRDIKRFFAYSSIEHMGIATIAFGIGGPVASFAGLLHMTMHSLTKSGIFMAVGHVVQARGTQRLDEIQGLTVSHPALGWGLLLGVLAIAGLPPFGLFMSEFLLISSAITDVPWIIIPLSLGLVMGLGALVLRVQAVCFGEPMGTSRPLQAQSLVPLYLHLALVFIGGLWLPTPVAAWFHAIAGLLA